MAGLLVSALGALLFYPAAQFHMYGFFLSALFVLGLGFTLLQISANPYVAILGSEESASSRLNLAQGFNSLGTTISPVIGGFLIFTFFKNSAGSDAVKIPYLVFAFLFVLIAIFIHKTKLPVFTNSEDQVKGFGAFKYPQLVFGMFAIFMYVGAEVSIGSMIINFLHLPEIAGMNETEASTYVSFYWGGQMIGRFLGAISLSEISSKVKKYSLMLIVPIVSFVAVGLITDFAIAIIYGILLIINYLAFVFAGKKANRNLYVFAGVNILLLAVVLNTTGQLALWSLVGIGLFNSIMWSNIFTLAISGLGKYTSQGSSLLVMMILGGAILPLITGAVADAYGIQMSFVVPVLCYFYLMFYGLIGFKQNKIEL
jgi:FHS family L-fucose permease-like MFS transporter